MKLDPSYQYIAFTKGTGLISRLMDWFQKGDWSHVLLLNWNLTWEAWEVMDTTSGGVRVCAWEAFKKSNHVVKVFKCDHDLVPTMRNYYGLVGDPKDEYDYWSILGFVWIKLMWWWFAVKIRNPLNNPKAWVCSGFVHRVFNQSKLPGYNEPLEYEIIDPDALYEFMVKSDVFKEVILLW